VLLLLGLDAQRGPDEVAQRARVVDVRRRQLQLFGEVGDEADDPREEALNVTRERRDLRRVGDDVRHVLELAHEVRVGALPLDQADATDSLDEHAQGPVGDADELVDAGRGPDLVQVVPAGLLGLGVADGHERELAIGADDVVDQADRALLADRQRRHRVREHDRFLEREERELAHRVSTRMRTLVERACGSASGNTIDSRPRS
jgi:hypothetical protein